MVALFHRLLICASMLGIVLTFEAGVEAAKGVLG